MVSLILSVLACIFFVVGLIFNFEANKNTKYLRQEGVIDDRYRNALKKIRDYEQSFKYCLWVGIVLLILSFIF